jgi:dihydropyrimidinase/dihydroorotase
MEGHEFTGWPVMTILRGRVTAEWADDSPGMRPVGEPAGQYLPRQVKGAGRALEVTSPVRLPRPRRMLADDFERPGFAKETLRYTSAKEV